MTFTEDPHRLAPWALARLSQTGRGSRSEGSAFLAALIVLAVFAGCASRQPEQIPRPMPPAVRRGSLAITNGIRILGSVELPTGFVPDLSYGPIWLGAGTEVGVAGTVDGRSALLGFGLPKLADGQRIIAEDFGIGAARGRILDVASSGDGSDFAIAIAEPTENRVDVILRGEPGVSDGRTVATIAGTFAGAQLRWLNATTIAIALEASSPDAPIASPSGAQDVFGIFLIKVTDPPATRALTRIQCDLGRLSFGPNGRFAVAQGDPETSPALIDLQNETCAPLRRRGPVRVIAWAPDESAFLYVAPGERGVPGVFRYDRASGSSVVVAIASGAAAYAADGTIIALGNDGLTWRAARDAPGRAVVAQVAAWTVGQQEISINSIGFETTPELLARASMVFAPSSDAGVIDIAAVKASQPVRELIEYSYPTRAAFVLAATSLDAAIGMSWSPDGKLIALIDASAQPNILTVIAPPR